MNRRAFLRATTIAGIAGGVTAGRGLLATNAAKPRAPRKPNIVILYADDLGYGDPGCYGSKAIPTPNIDAIAKRGLRFTNGYCSAPTCTPSRYSLLTGEAPFRNSRAKILPGDAAMIIKTDQPTLPKMLQKAGYLTGIVGKWHLGLGTTKGGVDWNKKITPGTNEVGFDESYIMAATNDRVPCVYVKNGTVVGLDPNDPILVNYGTNFPGEPTGRKNPELLKMKHSKGHDCSIVNGIGRIGYMKGGKKALWTDEDMADVFTAKAVDFLNRNAKKDKPFFLYFALHQPHVPRVPNKRFVGTTKLGPRGDVIVEMDWCVGEVLKTLKTLGIEEDTLVIFSSDNGPVLDNGYHDQSPELNGDHKAGGIYRGRKASPFEAGTRVPFITSWPGTIKPGVSDAMVSQTDFFASFASLVGETMPEGKAIDSVDIMPALLGESDTGIDVFYQKYTLRQGHWKVILPKSGRHGTKTLHLFNLLEDPGETTNVAKKNPAVVKRLLKLHKKILARKVKR
ncbi:MAG: arylsulfatase [Phycisphaerales bacterium]|jgi:arylsulfatase A-like enzyme|nr:arylsulfatase [Phycisphaerales bacterium]MBT7170609.1 arylsulfatase [Phycisphaerales bacterium]